MINGFEKIVEERIREAQRRGLFDNLDGAGRPLPPDEIGMRVPEDLRLAFRMLKNADCLPPELELKKEIHQTEELLAGVQDAAERYHTLSRLNFLIFKLNAMRTGSIANDIPQHYNDKLLERLEGSAGR
jgi:hypothetical protein